MTRAPFLLVACAGLVALAVSSSAQQPIQPRVGDPLDGLSAGELERFARGKEAFQHTFLTAEGAGPVMNQFGYSGRCDACHFAPAPGGGALVSVRRFAAAATASTPFDPLVSLGGPIQQRLALTSACLEIIPPQADIVADRLSPSVAGLGLVEEIADADILVREAFPPPGVSGRTQWTTPLETPLGPPRVGRFGWKSQVATLLTFSGQALLEEHGITNRLFPLDNVQNGSPGSVHPCNDPVPDPEDVSDAQGYQVIDRVSDFVRFLAPPPQTPRSGMRGEIVFETVGCTRCHVSTPYGTSPVAANVGLRSRTLKPYSDFLLHDVGTGDGFLEGLATGAEMRTPPLWGVTIRASGALLHDGRVSSSSAGARGNLDAAILAHGGEAQPVTTAYQAASAADRSDLLAFLLSLGRMEFDYDPDNQVVWADWFFLRLDVTGPGSFFDADDRRAIADIDQDGDIDLRDIAAFQRAYTGD